MKVCRICNQDCSSRPRVRDAEGVYYCKACLEKRKAAEARAPASVPAAAPARADAYSLADIMEDNGLGGAQMCPQCGNAMRVGAALCVRCGYDAQKGKSLKTAVTIEKAPKEPREKRASSGAGLSMLTGLFDESPILPVLVALVHVGVIAAAMSNDDMKILFFGVSFLIGTAVSIWGLVLMFFESVVHAIVGFFCWFYWLYWVVVHSDNRALQLCTLVSILGWFGGAAMIGLPEQP